MHRLRRTLYQERGTLSFYILIILKPEYWIDNLVEDILFWTKQRLLSLLPIS